MKGTYKAVEVSAPDLAKLAIEAHGGLERWNSFTTLSALTRIGLLALFLFLSSTIAYAQQHHSGDMQASTNSYPWTNDHSTISATEADTRVSVSLRLYQRRLTTTDRCSDGECSREAHK
jgi:hypothetical protein